MKILVALAFLAVTAAEVAVPEPVQLPDARLPLVQPDTRPLIVPPQIYEALKYIPAKDVIVGENPAMEDIAVDAVRIVELDGVDPVRIVDVPEEAYVDSVRVEDTPIADHNPKPQILYRPGIFPDALLR